MSSQNWYDNGKLGRDGPSSSEQDKSPGAYEKWDQGREAKRWEDKTFYTLTHPDDPFGAKKGQY